MRHRFGAVAAITFLLLAISLTALAGGNHDNDDWCEKYPWKCQTTTTVYEETTTSNTTTTPTTVPSSTTPTTEPSTSTTPTSTPSSTTSTTSPAVTTTVPTGSSTTVDATPAEWSWNVECGIVFVDFGPEILEVELQYYGQVFHVFTEPGAYAILEDHTVHVELVPIADGDHFPVPDSVKLTVDVCSVVPPVPSTLVPTPTLVPNTPPAPVGPVEELPYTGVPGPVIGALALALISTGGIMLRKFRSAS